MSFDDDSLAEDDDLIALEGLSLRARLELLPLADFLDDDDLDAALLLLDFFGYSNKQTKKNEWINKNPSSYIYDNKIQVYTIPYFNFVF